MVTNTLVNSTIITRETLRLLKNNLAFTKHINRQYDSDFAQSGAKIGNQLKIRKPVPFVVRNGATYTPQNITESSVTLTVATQIGVDFEFPDVDLTLQVDDFSNRYLKPAAVELANTLDAAIIALALAGTTNVVGTSPNMPTKSNTFLQAGALLTNNKAPRTIGDRFVILSPDAEAAAIEQSKTIFNPQGVIGAQYQTGQLTQTLGWTFDVDQNITTVLGFHKDAYTLVTADMELPGGVDMASRASSDGISLRFIRDYDGINDKRICRFDLLYGFAVVRPELALKIFEV